MNENRAMKSAKAIILSFFTLLPLVYSSEHLCRRGAWPSTLSSRGSRGPTPQTDLPVGPQLENRLQLTPTTVQARQFREQNLFPKGRQCCSTQWKKTKLLHELARPYAPHEWFKQKMGTLVCGEMWQQQEGGWCGDFLRTQEKHSTTFHVAQIQSCSVHVHLKSEAKDARCHPANRGLGGNDEMEVRGNLEQN